MGEVEVVVADTFSKCYPLLLKLLLSFPDLARSFVQVPISFRYWETVLFALDEKN